MAAKIVKMAAKISKKILVSVFWVFFFRMVVLDGMKAWLLKLIKQILSSIQNGCQNYQMAAKLSKWPPNYLRDGLFINVVFRVFSSE